MFTQTRTSLHRKYSVCMYIFFAERMTIVEYQCICICLQYVQTDMQYIHYVFYINATTSENKKPRKILVAVVFLIMKHILNITSKQLEAIQVLLLLISLI